MDEHKIIVIMIITVKIINDMLNICRLQNHFQKNVIKIHQNVVKNIFSTILTKLFINRLTNIHENN